VSNNSRRKGKALGSVRAKLDRAQRYSFEDALALLRQVPPAKFDESLEVAVNLAIDTRQSDQVVRGTVTLPHGTGKVPRVAVFATGEPAREAREAGADEVGAEDLVKKIEEGWEEFDVLVATPDLMRIVGRLGRKLGPRMPSKKAGNITPDVGGAVRELKAGRLEFRADKAGVVHVPMGKMSFDDAKLRDNFVTLITEISRSRPAGVKGQYLKSVSISSTMGPGLKLDLHQVRELAAQT
jgi:large subunit ribosomal protein L1